MSQFEFLIIKLHLIEKYKISFLDKVVQIHIISQTTNTHIIGRQDVQIKQKKCSIQVHTINVTENNILCYHCWP